ncbi:MAG: biotin/lipoate A/B protein ligase family protein [Candidatus Sericytochromatia bacterium]
MPRTISPSPVFATLLRRDPAMPGCEQMQRDQQYYSRFDPQKALPLLRFYTWSEPCLSWGRFQQPTPALTARLQALNLPAVRRPTGGGAILHAGDLTFSLVGPSSWLPGNLLQGHALISRALVAGLHRLGIEADAGGALQRQQPEHCFASITPADIQVSLGKLVGTAQVRRRQAFLIQGTIYLNADRGLLQALFGAAEPPLADLAQLLGAPPAPERVIEALSHGFASVLGLDFIPG